MKKNGKVGWVCCCSNKFESLVISNFECNMQVKISELEILRWKLSYGCVLDVEIIIACWNDDNWEEKLMGSF